MNLDVNIRAAEAHAQEQADYWERNGTHERACIRCGHVQDAPNDTREHPGDTDTGERWCALCDSPTEPT